MKSKGRRKAFSKWTASVCGKTEGLFIKYWSCNQWTIPHTYHTYHTAPTIVLTYKNMPTKIRDSLPIINPDLFVSYVKICRPVQFAFVISKKWLLCLMPGIRKFPLKVHGGLWKWHFPNWTTSLQLSQTCLHRQKILAKAKLYEYLRAWKTSGCLLAIFLLSIWRSW